MGDKTGIEWTEATWNPVVGCSIVSPGCRRCYAMREAARLERMGGKGGEKYSGLTRVVNGRPIWTGVVRLHEPALDQPLRWKRSRRIFVNSMSDLFHESLPDAAIEDVFAVMATAAQHTFQVLTKRPERMRAFLAERRWPISNVWLGASVEDQLRADERREHLRAVAELGWLTWVSYEPALGPVDWSGWEFIRWLVSGGESGDDAHPTHPAWHRAAREWCASHQIEFLFKQWGEWGATAYSGSTGLPVIKQFADFQQWVNKASGWVAPADICLDTAGNVLRNGAGFMAARDAGQFPVAILRKLGKRRAGRHLDGVLHDGYPQPRTIGLDHGATPVEGVEVLTDRGQIIATLPTGTIPQGEDA